MRSSLAVLAAAALAACSPEASTGPTALFEPSFDVVPDPGGVIHVAVCKVGLDDFTIGQGFDFTSSATGGTVLAPSFSLSAVAEANLDLLYDCELVWGRDDVSYDSDTEITVTEIVPDGYSLADVEVWYQGTRTSVQAVDGSVTVTPEGGFKHIVFFNESNSEGVGRMTGGGNQIRIDGVRVTRGLTLHCDITLSNNLEINWSGGNKWHLEKESLESVSCIDDPAYDPVPPDAPFDTFIARAIGSLNGTPGSIIDFKFIDDGEPGRTDEAHFTVYAAGAGPGQVAAGDEVVALEVGGQLDGGNLQAHYDQPHR